MIGPSLPATRVLGDCGLAVTPIGLGLAALGRPGYINLGHGDDLAAGRDEGAMHVHCHRMLDLAWDAGIRYVDAARSYGLAETFLGEWLRRRRDAGAEVPVVGSKWGYTYTAGWSVEAKVHEVKDHRLPVLERQWAESSDRLGPWLRLYQVHSATLESGVLDDAAVLGRLAALKAQGLAIGLTLSGPRQADTVSRALSIAIDGRRLFDTVQATWNLLEPSSGPALAEAAAAGLGVIVKEAVANGRLTARNREPGFAARRAVLDREAERLGTTLDGLAIAAALAQPWSGCVLSGAATPDHLAANLAALSVPWDAAAEAALAAIAEAPGDYWRRRGELAWN